MYVEPAPTIHDLLTRMSEESVAASFEAAVGSHQVDDRYLHWDKLRRLEAPNGLSPEQWWLKLKLARQGELRRIPLTNPDGESFGFTLPDRVFRHLHHIDQHAGGEVAMDEVVMSEGQARQRYLVNSLIE